MSTHPEPVTQASGGHPEALAPGQDPAGSAPATMRRRSPPSWTPPRRGRARWSRSRWRRRRGAAAPPRGSSRARRGRRSRPASSPASAGLPAARSSATRRRARSSAVAVRKNFASAFGKTTVPMSRPSTTTPPAPPIRRCRPSSAARTSGSAETRDAPSEISGVRIDEVSSSPLANTRFNVPSSRNESSRPSASDATPGPSSQAIPRCARAQRHRPVDRARVEQRVPEPLGQQARGGRFPGPRGPVNRHDQPPRRPPGLER